MFFYCCQHLHRFRSDPSSTTTVPPNGRGQEPTIYCMSWGILVDRTRVLPRLSRILKDSPLHCSIKQVGGTKASPELTRAVDHMKTLHLVRISTSITIPMTIDASSSPRAKWANLMTKDRTAMTWDRKEPSFQVVDLFVPLVVLDLPGRAPATRTPVE